MTALQVQCFRIATAIITFERQLIGVKLFITRFNSIFNEKGFVPHRKLAAPAELPVILDKLLFVYRTHCSEKGNCAVLSRNTIAVRIGFLRKFLEFLRFKKIPVYIPPSLKRQDNYVPYLFSDDEVHRIFEAADSLKFSYHAKSNVELSMLLRMLYSLWFSPV